MKIYFSFDDGHPDDFRLIKLFEKYQFPIMLFIPRYNTENFIMTSDNIKSIKSEIVEIGAHTYNHKRLNIVNKEEILFELIKGQHYLEDLLSEPINHFCFPGGQYNNLSMNLALDSFSTIRTAETICLNHNKPIINTFFHFYNRKKTSIIFNSFKNISFNNGILYSLYYSNSYFDFLKKYISLSSSENTNDELIIWGHSWEISKFNLWQELEDLLNFISINHKSDVYKYSDII